MKTKKSARYLLLSLILIIVVLACICSVGGGDKGGSGGSPQASPISGGDLTATFGAEMFHAQLTAIAEGTPTAQAP
jgi:hypothetical protein